MFRREAIPIATPRHDSDRLRIEPSPAAGEILKSVTV